jgi:hypothetical protein
VAVVEQQAVDKIDMHQVLQPYGASAQGLTLMTCGGPFDTQKDQYDDRVIVYATRTP